MSESAVNRRSFLLSGLLPAFASYSPYSANFKLFDVGYKTIEYSTKMQYLRESRVDIINRFIDVMARDLSRRGVKFFTNSAWEWDFESGCFALIGKEIHPEIILQRIFLPFKHSHKLDLQRMARRLGWDADRLFVKLFYTPNEQIAGGHDRGHHLLLYSQPFYNNMTVDLQRNLC